MTAPDRREFLRSTAQQAAAVALVPHLGLLERFRPQEPIRVGLVGAGRQGRAILGELATIENVTVAAVCDDDPSRLSSGLRRIQGAKGFGSHAELIERGGVDALVIATPTHLHRQPALDALSAGLHVYCEAPLAHTVEDCRAIARAARGAKGIFQTGYQARSNPVYGLARSFSRAGALRDVVALRAHYARKTSWRTPSSTPEREREINWHLDPELTLGLEGEVGSHQLDTLHWFLDRYPVSVTGRGDLRLYDDGREVPDTVHLDFTYDDGLGLAYSATIANSYEGRYELLVGSMATIKLAWTHGWMFKESDSPTQGWEVYANRQHFHNDEGITLIADATKLASQGKLKEGVGLPNSSLYYALADFLKSATEGHPVACTAAEGLRTTVVAIQAHQAVAQGGEVAIDPALLKDE